MGLSRRRGRLGAGEPVRPDSWGDPARAAPAPRGGIPTRRGHAPALEACGASLVRPAGGSIAQPGISRERGAVGLGPGTWVSHAPTLGSWLMDGVGCRLGGDGRRMRPVGAERELER